jgi:UDP-3-O-[3-hydroxymyristoyl] glucosamine N-acyltransferase
LAEEFRLGELAQRLSGRVIGDPERLISGIAPLDQAGPEQISFLTNPKYRQQAVDSRAGALLVAPGSDLSGRDLLEVKRPQLALANLLTLMNPPQQRESGVDESACLAAGLQLGEDIYVGPFTVIERDSKIGNRVTIGAGCVIGPDCSIGDDTDLKPGVILYPGTQIGAGCLIHSGTVLGADGFGFATDEGVHHKIPQLGHVVIEDDVEIGANCTVDRGALGDTRIGKGSKLDNLVMVAHGVQLGAAALLAAQSGIAGSTKVGERTIWAGQSGAAGHLEIGDGTIVAAKSAVFADTEKGAFVAGIPAIDHRQWKRAQVILKHLPEMRRELRDLRKRLAALEEPGPKPAEKE